MKVIAGALIAAALMPSAASAQIKPDDYPPLALRQNHEGTVGYRLHYGADGRATDCTVTSSSGYPELDAATCSLMMKRGRFKPGKPGTHEDTTTWKIPAGL